MTTEERKGGVRVTAKDFTLKEGTTNQGAHIDVQRTGKVYLLIAPKKKSQSSKQANFSSG